MTVSPVHCLTADSVEALAPLVQDWSQLATRALESNVFYEPEVLLSALENNAEGWPLLFLFVYRSNSPGDKELIGFFPFMPPPAGSWRSVAFYENFTHLHCFLCSPLLHREHAEVALTSLLDWIDTAPGGVRQFGLYKIRGDGPQGELLHNLLAERRQPHILRRSHERAQILVEGSYEDYLARAVPARKRKEYRRLRRRLEEHGTLRLETRSSDEESFAWTDRFLQMEAAGWKGLRGVAMDNTSVDSAYFHDKIERLGREQRLMLQTLYLDDRPIAMKCNLLSADGVGSFAFKIAFDEEFAAYSPGVMLELENMRHLLSSGTLSWMDSCADPNHPMIDHLWRERRRIESMLIGSRGLRGRLLLAWSRRKLRGGAP